MEANVHNKEYAREIILFEVDYSSPRLWGQRLLLAHWAGMGSHWCTQPHQMPTMGNSYYIHKHKTRLITFSKYMYCNCRYNV